MQERQAGYNLMKKGKMKWIDNDFVFIVK